MHKPIMKVIKFICLLFVFGVSAASAGDITVTVRGPVSKIDTRIPYEQEVVRLALEKTKDKYGGYKLIQAPGGINAKRIQHFVENKEYENFIVKFSVSPDRLDKMLAIPFPADLGIVGYRVAFVSEETKQRLKSIQTINELRQLSIIQGLGWLDTEILISQGYYVDAVPNYEGMFKMVAGNRADLFLRGANELLDEWKTHQDIDNLAYDETFALYYPLPRFFFTSKENVALSERIYEGLLTAYEDGSLQKIWEQLYRPSLDFVKLGKRRLFRLENPLIEGLDPSWQKFVFQP